MRGSLSMRDAITDLTAIEDTLELNSCPLVTVVQSELSFSNPNRSNSITENILADGKSTAGNEVCNFFSVHIGT